MRVLGIDPGTATTGIGIVESNKSVNTLVMYGVIATKAQAKLARRLQSIYNDLEDLLKLYKPDVVVVEELFFNTNAKTAIQVGQARGVILLASVNNKLPIYEYTALQVKNVITGYGRADKKQMQQMIKVLLKLKEIPKPDDSADALGLAICHLRFNQTLAKLANKNNDSLS